MSLLPHFTTYFIRNFAKQVPVMMPKFKIQFGCVFHRLIWGPLNNFATTFYSVFGSWTLFTEGNTLVFVNIFRIYLIIKVTKRQLSCFKYTLWKEERAAIKQHSPSNPYTFFILPSVKLPFNWQHCTKQTFALQEICLVQKSILVKHYVIYLIYILNHSQPASFNNMNHERVYKGISAWICGTNVIYFVAKGKHLNKSRTARNVQLNLTSCYTSSEAYYPGSVNANLRAYLINEER